MAFVEVNILDKVISAFVERGCELEDETSTWNTTGFDTTFLTYHKFQITIYSKSAEADQWVCYIGIKDDVSGEGRCMEWRTNYDNNYENYVDKLMMEMKRMEQENKMNSIKKDFQ
jgi:hypothetical protein